MAFLNIGQGDAVYIQDTDGKSILVDAGPKDDGVLTRIQEVTRCDIVHIDTLLLTHPDADHIGEAERLIDKGLVGRVAQNGFMDIDQGDETLTENRLEAMNILKMDVNTGDLLELKDIRIQILYPNDEPYGTTTKKGKVDDNLYSVVTKVVSKKESFLLTGDAPISVEKKLIAKYEHILDSDVLKLGHHGSKGSTDQGFLSIVSPDEVVVSAGKDNKYHHPNEETLNRVAEQQRKKPLRIRETFTEGNIIYYLD
ncbi:MAG: MBL fold metallo-hydrolase [Patescibacteria group bacterium]